MSEVNPNVLSEIMAIHGRDLSEAEIDALIAGFRAERAKMLAAKAAGKKAPTSSIKAPVKKIMDVGELGL